jgi:hypothetical protein
MSPSPEPQQVQTGRDRILTGERRPDRNERIRPFFCRSCGKDEIGVLVPRGWYTLIRNVGDPERTPIRLGLYCSIRCLMSQGSRLVGIEDDLGDGFDRVPSGFRQQRTTMSTTMHEMTPGAPGPRKRSRWAKMPHTTPKRLSEAPATILRGFRGSQAMMHAMIQARCLR